MDRRPDPRRRWALVALVLFGLSLAAGCGRPIIRKVDPKGPVRLTFWVSYNNEEIKLFEGLIDRFEKRYQARHGRKLEIVLGRVPFDGLLPKLKTACQTRTTPDVCRVDLAHVVPLAYGGAIHALDEIEGFPWPSLDAARQGFVEAAIDSNLFPVKQKDGSWKRHLYGLPDQTNCVCLFTNRRVLQRAGDALKREGFDPKLTPRTWDELIQVGRLVTNPDAGVYAIGLTNTLWWTLPFFNSFGTDFIHHGTDGSMDCVLNSERGQAALALKVRLCREPQSYGDRTATLEPGLWRSGAISPDQAFQNDKVAFILSGPWRVKTFRDAGVDFTVSPLPEGPAGAISTVGGTNLVIFKSCPHPEAALELLRYIASDEFQIEWCQALGQVPVRTTAIDKVDLSRWPALGPFYRQIKHTKARPRVPRYDLLEEICNAETELALSGEKTVKQALDDAVKLINERLLSKVR